MLYAASNDFEFVGDCKILARATRFAVVRILSIAVRATDFFCCTGVTVALRLMVARDGDCAVRAVIFFAIVRLTVLFVALRVVIVDVCCRFTVLLSRTAA